eukprot:1344803-Pyramimonas_sp.AAC.1
MLKVPFYLTSESRQLSRRFLIQSCPLCATDLLTVNDEAHGSSGTPTSKFQRCQLALGDSLDSSDDRPEQVGPT